MPNQPAPNTVATSFTLPRDLLSVVERVAKKNLTNKSDIIRRALMNYLAPAERAWVQQQVAHLQSLHAAEQPNPPPVPGTRRPVTYSAKPKSKRKNPVP